MSVVLREVVDPALLEPIIPSTVNTVTPGRKNWEDKRGVYAVKSDGIYPAFSDATAESLYARKSGGADDNQRSLLVAMTFVAGSVSVPRIGAAIKTTCTSSQASALVAFMSCTNNTFVTGRFKTGSYGQFTRTSVAYTLPSASAEYTIFFGATASANSGGSSASRPDYTAWMTREDAWGTDLFARQTLTDEDNADYEGNTQRYGAFCLETHSGTKITKYRAWEWDGTFSAIAWADSDPSGPLLKCTEIGGSGAAATYQWSRSTTYAGSYSNLASGTTAHYQDTTAVEGTLYYYKCVVTRASSVTSEIVRGYKLPAALKIGFVGPSEMTVDANNFAGTSQTYTLGTIPQLVGDKLAARSGRSVTVTNSAVSGSTSAQWVSGQTNMTNALAAFASAGVTHVLVFPCVQNDVLTSVTAATHKANTLNTCNTLIAAGYKVLLSYGGYHFPSNAAGRGGPELDLITDYNTANDTIINNTSIRAAGRTVPKMSVIHMAGLDDLVHPGLKLSQKIADVMANDFYNAINGTTTSGGTGASYTGKVTPDEVF